MNYKSLRSIELLDYKCAAWEVFLPFLIWGYGRLKNQIRQSTVPSNDKRMKKQTSGPHPSHYHTRRYLYCIFSSSISIRGVHSRLSTFDPKISIGGNRISWSTCRHTPAILPWQLWRLFGGCKVLWILQNRFSDGPRLASSLCSKALTS